MPYPALHGMLALAIATPVAHWPASAGPPPAASAPEPEHLGPRTISSDPGELWLARRQRLRIAFGLTGGLVVASGLGLVIAATRPSPDNGAIDGYPIATIVFASLGSVALIACFALAGTLGVHAGRRPQRRLQLAPGGLRLQF